MKRMMWLMNVVMLSCQKATLLMEKKLHSGISFGEKLQLFMHKQMCDSCRLYEKQSHFLHSILKKKSSQAITPTTISKTLPEDVKYRILKELKKS